MRNLLYALPFFAFIAWAQDPPAKLMQGADHPPQDKATLERLRTEGSAGGTGQPLSDDAKKSVGAGAGPHLQQPSRPYKRREHSEKGSQAQDAQSERQGARGEPRN
jgi:hypothetical protein